MTNQRETPEIFKATAPPCDSNHANDSIRDPNIKNATEGKCGVSMQTGFPEFDNFDWPEPPPAGDILEFDKKAKCESVPEPVQASLGDYAHAIKLREWDDRYVVTSSSIRVYARRLVGHYGWTLTDAEDIEQTLLEHVWSKSDAYDKTKGAWCTYLRTLCERKVVNMVEFRTAKKRDQEWRMSLEA